MKKFFIILMFACLAAATVESARAQSRYYHLVGDTIRGKSPIYYYQWWPTLNTNNESPTLISACGSDSFTGYLRFTPDSTLRIVGMAATAVSYENVYAENPTIGFDSIIDTAQYLILFDATPSGPVELARVCWTDDYLTHPHRYIVLPETTTMNRCNSLDYHTFVVQMREYYFDNPITVSDSFYLGWQYLQYEMGDDYTRMFDWMANHNGIMFSCLMSPYLTAPLECNTQFPRLTYLRHQSSEGGLAYDGNAWEIEQGDYLTLVFPIIEVDTTNLPYDTALFSCSIPKLTLQPHGEWYRLSWDSLGSHEWEVSVVASGDNPDDGRIERCDVPYINLYGLSRDTTYNVYVRGHCRTRMWDGWSDWSRPEVIAARPQPPIGIASVGTIDFTLTPNPASGRVTVTLPSAAVGTATVLDLQGRQMLTVPIDGTEASIDISGLPAATYMVTLSTNQGTSSHRLTVQ